MIQGENEEEYLRCFNKTIELLQPGDCLGFGGVAKVSTNKKVKQKLFNVLPYIVKEVINKRITSIHFFGVAKISVIKEIKKINFRITY